MCGVKLISGLCRGQVGRSDVKLVLLVNYDIIKIQQPRDALEMSHIADIRVDST